MNQLSCSFRNVYPLSAVSIGPVIHAELLISATTTSAADSDHHVWFDTWSTWNHSGGRFQTHWFLGYVRLVMYI